MTLVMNYLPRMIVASIANIVDLPAIDSFKSIVLQTMDMDSQLFYKSKKPFGERLLVPLASRTSHERLVTWIMYKGRQLFESGLINLLTGKMYLDIKMTQVSDMAIINCLEGNVSTESTPPKPFGFEFFLPIFKLCLYMIFSASITLLREKLYYRYI